MFALDLVWSHVALRRVAQEMRRKRQKREDEEKEKMKEEKPPSFIRGFHSAS